MSNSFSESINLYRISWCYACLYKAITKRLNAYNIRLYLKSLRMGMFLFKNKCSFPSISLSLLDVKGTWKKNFKIILDCFYLVLQIYIIPNYLFLKRVRSVLSDMLTLFSKSKKKNSGWLGLWMRYPRYNKNRIKII